MDTETALRLLALKPDYTGKQLKAAYRKAVKTNHPDKVPKLLSEEIKQSAERRTKQIDLAYDFLLSTKK